MKKNCLKIVFPLVFLLIAGIAVVFPYGNDIPAGAATLEQQKGELNTIKSKYNESSKKTAQIRSELAERRSQIKSREDEKFLLDEEIVALTHQIQIADSLIAEYEAAIKDTEAERSALTSKKQQQYELLAEILKTNYMNGEENSLELILGSTSIEDFLRRLDFLHYHMTYSERLINEINSTEKVLGEIDGNLTAAKASLEQLKTECTELNTELSDRLEKLDVIIAELKNDANFIQGTLEAEEALNKQIEAEMTALSKRIAEQEAQLRKNNPDYVPSKGTGILSWPLDRKPQTSSYGPRKDPFTGKSAFHNGLDIAAPRNTPIWAADSGVVVRASTYGTYGECVIIDHGNGLMTLYAHCNAYNVTNGQKVSKGDVIAYVGTTGRSTGYHLHFTVFLNGKHQDPLKYLP